MQVGEQLLRDLLFIHLDQPADKLQLTVQMLLKLYALVSCGCQREASATSPPQAALPDCPTAGHERTSPHSPAPTCPSHPNHSPHRSLPPLQADRQCGEDNPDALTHHEVLLPGHLLLKVLREQLETALEAFRQQVRAPRL